MSVELNGKFRFSRIDWVIGFFVPLGLFWELGSPILLATSGLVEENFALPLSFFLLPITFLLALMRFGDGGAVYSKIFTSLSGYFFLYCFVLSFLATIQFDSDSIQYGLQWALFTLWIPYFSTLYSKNRFESFCKGFFVGTVFTVLYYFISGILEIALYGGLLDGGRMSQNFIFPGQYQIAVYLPTVISYSTAMCTALYHLNLIKCSRPMIVALNILSLITLTFCGTREAFVVSLLFLVAFSVVNRDIMRAIISFVILIVCIALILFIAGKIGLIDFEASRLFDKFMKLGEPGKQFGSRDVMIQDAIEVFYDNPLFGSNFLPPNVASSTVDAPSAHNMYVDALVWTGMLGGLSFFLICLTAFITAIVSIVNKHSNPYVKLIPFIVILIMLISNNINVPIRQPIFAPFFSFSIFMLYIFGVKRK